MYPCDSSFYIPLYSYTKEASHVCYGRLPRLEYSNIAPMKKETLLKNKATEFVLFDIYSFLQLILETRTKFWRNVSAYLQSSDPAGFKLRYKGEKRLILFHTTLFATKYSIQLTSFYLFYYSLACFQMVQ